MPTPNSANSQMIAALADDGAEGRAGRRRCRRTGQRSSDRCSACACRLNDAGSGRCSDPAARLAEREPVRGRVRGSAEQAQQQVGDQAGQRPARRSQAATAASTAARSDPAAPRPAAAPCRPARPPARRTPSGPPGTGAEQQPQPAQVDRDAEHHVDDGDHREQPQPVGDHRAQRDHLGDEPEHPRRQARPGDSSAGRARRPAAGAARASPGVRVSWCALAARVERAATRRRRRRRAGWRRRRRAGTPRRTPPGRRDASTTRRPAAGSPSRPGRRWTRRAAGRRPSWRSATTLPTVMLRAARTATAVSTGAPSGAHRLRHDEQRGQRRRPWRCRRGTRRPAAARRRRRRASRAWNGTSESLKPMPATGQDHGEDQDRARGPGRRRPARGAPGRRTAGRSRRARGRPPRASSANDTSEVVSSATAPRDRRAGPRAARPAPTTGRVASSRATSQVPGRGPRRRRRRRRWRRAPGEHGDGRAPARGVAAPSGQASSSDDRGAEQGGQLQRRRRPPSAA